MSTQGIGEWSTNGGASQGWYNGRKANVIKQKFTFAANASGTVLPKLPASTRRYWAVLHYGTAPTFTWAATHNSPTGAIVLTDVAPSSLNGTLTTDIMLLGSTTLTANTKVRGLPANSKDVDTGTSEVQLYVVPYAATTSASNTTRFSTSYAIASGDVYLTVYYEKFDDSPNV